MRPKHEQADQDVEQFRKILRDTVAKENEAGFEKLGATMGTGCRTPTICYTIE
ncbi:hypothetical protein BH09VER1_BH09VER1_46660 [soil metagenome]